MAVDRQKMGARRAIRILWILQGHSFDGLRLKQITEQLQTSNSSALMDLEMLAEEGVVERIPGKSEYWRLTPRLIQLARAHEQETQELHRKVDEFNHRCTRLPN